LVSVVGFEFKLEKEWRRSWIKREVAGKLESEEVVAEMEKVRRRGG